MDPSHLQRSLFQRTLAPKAWGGGGKGSLALVRTPPAPQKCPPQGCQLGPRNGSCPAGPGLGQAQSPARHGCSESSLPLTPLSLRKSYDKWYLHRPLELGGILVVQSTSISFDFSSISVI